jgi:hypothetical protein
VKNLDILFKYINENKEIKNKSLHYKVLHGIYFRAKKKYHGFKTNYFKSLNLHDINDNNLCFFFSIGFDYEDIISFRKKNFRTDEILDYSWLITHRKSYKLRKKKPSELKSPIIKTDYNFLEDDTICDETTYKIIYNLKKN